MTTAMTERAKTTTLVVCCVGQGMVVLDVSVVNVALPAMQQGLGFSATSLAWVVNAYTLVFAGFLLLGGRLADLVAGRTVFLAAFGLFSGASLIGGLAPSATWLVLARGLQGLGAAALAPVTLSILNTTFIEIRERHRALAVWGAVGAAGGALGMLLGGVLTELVSWRAILAINVPIGVVTMLVATRALPRTTPTTQPARGKLDVAGAVTVSAGLIAVVYGLVQTESLGPSSFGAWGPILLGVGLLALFVLVEHRLATAPLMPLGIFRHRCVAVGNAVVFLLGFVMLSMWYFVTLYLQKVLGYDPVAAGLAFAPMAALLGVCSRVAGPLAHRIGAAPVTAVGLGLAAIGMLLFARAPAHGHYLSDVLPAMLVAAVGVGLGFVAVTIAATSGVPADSAGLVTA